MTNDEKPNQQPRRKLPSLRKPMAEPDPQTDATSDQPDLPPRHPMQLSLKMLLMLMLIASVASAVWGGLRNAGQNRVFYVLFSMAAPLAVLVIVGILHQWNKYRQQWKNRRQR